jgi:hypothetical protein
MTRTRRASTLAVGALLLACAGRALAQAPAPPSAAKETASRIDPRADDAVKKMAAFLSAAKSFSVEAEETFDAEFARAYRIALTNVRTITIERPSRFAADATGDTLHRSSWFDGRSLSVLNRKANAYAVLDMQGTIDQVLDTLATDYEVVLPLSDLLYSDPYATLMEGVLYGKYLGLHQAAGVPCHHLTFGQEGVEWQLWIDAGAQPLPRKLAIAYWELAGVPQYHATFRRWNLSPRLEPGLFQFKPPADAKKVDLAGLAER